VGGHRSALSQPARVGKHYDRGKKKDSFPLAGQDGSVSEPAPRHRTRDGRWEPHSSPVRRGPAEGRAADTYISQPGTPGRPCAALGGWGKADSCCPSGNRRCWAPAARRRCTCGRGSQTSQTSWRRDWEKNPDSGQICACYPCARLLLSLLSPHPAARPPASQSQLRTSAVTQHRVPLTPSPRPCSGDACPPVWTPRAHSLRVVGILLVDFLQHVDLQASGLFVLLHVFNDFESNTCTTPEGKQEESARSPLSRVSAPAPRRTGFPSQPQPEARSAASHRPCSSQKGGRSAGAKSSAFPLPTQSPEAPPARSPARRGAAEERWKPRDSFSPPRSHVKHERLRRPPRSLFSPHRHVPPSSRSRRTSGDRCTAPLCQTCLPLRC